MIQGRLDFKGERFYLVQFRGISVRFDMVGLISWRDDAISMPPIKGDSLRFIRFIQCAHIFLIKIDSLIQIGSFFFVPSLSNAKLIKKYGTLKSTLGDTKLSFLG